MAEAPAYPKMPSTAWRTLRARAATAPSTKFTPATVAALLNMGSPESALGNVVRPLKQLGILDDEYALTERGNKWRIDSTYGEACQEILDEVYPSDLSALTTDEGAPDKGRVRTWLEHKGFGGSNAQQMASTYAMIAEKTPPEAPAPSSGKNEAREKGSTRPNPKSTPASSSGKGVTSRTPEQGGSESQDRANTHTGPNVHLDIQIHIPANASADQIDQIFASMAKHLYRP